jgi:hypothetical protein
MYRPAAIAISMQFVKNLPTKFQKLEIAQTRDGTTDLDEIKFGIHILWSSGMITVKFHETQSIL